MFSISPNASSAQFWYTFGELLGLSSPEMIDVCVLNLEAKSSQDLQGAITATQKLWRRYHLSYDQTQYVVKEVRRALTLERPTSQRLTGLLRDLFENQLRLALRVRYGDGTHNPLSHGIHTCETLSQKNPISPENAHRSLSGIGTTAVGQPGRGVTVLLIPSWLPFIMPPKHVAAQRTFGHAHGFSSRSGAGIGPCRVTRTL